MYRLHDALGHCARPSRRAHACRLGITLAGACRAHVATGSRRSFGRPAMELDGGRPRMRYVSKATIGLGVSLGAAKGLCCCRSGPVPRGGAGSVYRVGDELWQTRDCARRRAWGFFCLFVFVSCCSYLSQVSRVFVSFLYVFFYVSGWLCSPLASGVDSRVP